MIDENNPAVLAAILEWCQNNTGELTADEATRLDNAIATASTPDEDGRPQVTVDDLESEAQATLWDVACEVVRNHDLTVGLDEG